MLPVRAGMLLFQQYPDLVPLDGDALCRFHPDHDELMETDPVAVLYATAQTSRAWRGMSIDHAREQADQERWATRAAVAQHS